MAFNLDNYEQVKDRITRFYADHPDGRIITDLVTDAGSLATVAAFRASIYLGDILKATGYAFEAQGQGVNRDAWVENAETSAIGRALANMDYCGTLRPSREEMSKVGNEPVPLTLKPDPIRDELSSLAQMLGKTPAWKTQMMKIHNGDLAAILAELRKEAAAVEAQELAAT
jgi:hypothetical protein